MNGYAERIVEGWSGQFGKVGYKTVEEDVCLEGLPVFGSVVFWRERGKDGFVVRQRVVEEGVGYRVRATEVFAIGGARGLLENILPAYAERRVSLNGEEFEALCSLDAMRLYRSFERGFDLVKQCTEFLVEVPSCNSFG